MTTTMTARPFANVDARQIFFAALFAILISTLLNAAPVQIPFNPTMDVQAAPISSTVAQATPISVVNTLAVAQPAVLPVVEAHTQVTVLPPFMKQVELPAAPVSFRPVRLEVSSISLNVAVDAVSSTDETHKAVANWLNNSATLWNNQNLSFWGFDHGWRDANAQPFSALDHLTIGDELFIYDQMGIAHGYVYEQLTTVGRHETTVMDTNLKDQVTLIASGGKDIRDAQGRIIDSTHRRIFTFRPMSLSEAAMAGTH